MAGLLHPKSAPRIDKSAGESLVWKALKSGLPDGWRAWHSLRLRAGAKWEGEGDFVVAIPDRGLLVLEVKGGRLECVDGLWLQNGKRIDAPRDQAFNFAKQLVARLRKGGVEPPPWGIACVFPDSEFSVGPTSGDLDGLVVGRRELSWLSMVLPKVAERAIPAKPVPVDPAWIEAVHALWGETWSPHVRLRDRAKDAEERAIALNVEQLEILDMVEHNDHLLVEGAAGTGKTVLARELGLRRARDGRRVLYLCFTDALARTVGGWLADHVPPGVPSPVASSVRALAEQLVGVPWQEGAAWADLLRQAAARVQAGEAPYDLVIVDEAQDLEAADWALVEALVGPGGLWVFADPRQQFWNDRALPPHVGKRLGRSIRLTTQERNPPDVARIAAAYAGEPLQPLATGEERTVAVVTAEPGALEDVVARALDTFLRDGASPGDIAIVSLAGQTRTVVGTAERLGSHRVVRADAEDATTHVVSDTFLRFKGLERPFIVVVELGLAQGDRYEKRMHIALTRATVGVVVVAEPHVVEGDPRLR